MSQMEGVFQGLGMKSTFLTVPSSQMDNCAQGYTKNGTPVPAAARDVVHEGYEIWTTTRDLLRFLQANMGMLDLEARLQSAILDTYDDLAWEEYRYPEPAAQPDWPLGLHGTPLLSKIGLAQGFATYLAFVPTERLGIVLLANKEYSVVAQVTAAYSILKRLGGFAPTNPRRARYRGAGRTT